MINCAFNFRRTNVFGCFWNVMTQYEHIKHKIPNQTLLGVFICVALKSHTEWSNAQRVSASVTLTLPIPASTNHVLNCFSHVMYALQTSTDYQNIAKLLTHPIILFLILLHWKNVEHSFQPFSFVVGLRSTLTHPIDLMAGPYQEFLSFEYKWRQPDFLSYRSLQIFIQDQSSLIFFCSNDPLVNDKKRRNRFECETSFNSTHNYLFFFHQVILLIVNNFLRQSKFWTSVKSWRQFYLFPICFSLDNFYPFLCVYDIVFTTFRQFHSTGFICMVF